MAPILRDGLDAGGVGTVIAGDGEGDGEGSGGSNGGLGVPAHTSNNMACHLHTMTLPGELISGLNSREQLMPGPKIFKQETITLEFCFGRIPVQCMQRLTIRMVCSSLYVSMHGKARCL
jgi:hypothetical protein